MIKKKDKQFYWNKFCRNDYLYFANCRLYAHFWGFIYNYPSYNCFYVCSKNNGDINGSIINIKSKLEEPFSIQTNFWEISNDLIERVCLDLHYGNLGKYCYVIKSTKKHYILYRIHMKDLKEKNKILKQLKDYRKGKTKSKTNLNFMRLVEMTSALDPEIIVEYPKKKIKMFKNKKIYSNK